MLKELEDGDWGYVFHFAGKEVAGCASPACPPVRALPNDEDVSVEPFAREDVKRVIARGEGENDAADWLMVGELNDGRFFAITAGCDYTGWG